MRTNNQLNPLVTLGPGFKLGPHWWEATPAPPNEESESCGTCMSSQHATH